MYKFDVPIIILSFYTDTALCILHETDIAQNEQSGIRTANINQSVVSNKVCIVRWNILLWKNLE